MLDLCRVSASTTGAPTSSRGSVGSSPFIRTCKLAQDNPAAYLPALAKTLTNLGNLYRDMQRLAEADKANPEALDISRKLAKDDPAAYLPTMAMTLTNLGNVYVNAQRFAEADKTYS